MTMEKATIRVGDRTPWGDADYVSEWAPGIFFAATPGHGGVWLSPERRRQMPKGLRRRAWYEEDCDWAIPYKVFGEEIAAATGKDHREEADKSFRNWNPDLYEEVFGVKVTAAESYVRMQQEFEGATRDKFVVRSAIGSSSWNDRCPEGKVLATASCEATGETREYLINEKVYDEKRRATSFCTGVVVEEGWERVS